MKQKAATGCGGDYLNCASFVADTQHWAAKVLSLSNGRWLKRALGAARKRDSSKLPFSRVEQKWLRNKRGAPMSCSDICGSVFDLNGYKDSRYSIYLFRGCDNRLCVYYFRTYSCFAHSEQKKTGPEFIVPVTKKCGTISSTSMVADLQRFKPKYRHKNLSS